MKKTAKINQILGGVLSSDKSFYKKLWEESKLNSGAGKAEFKKLPIINKSFLETVVLPDRDYLGSDGFVKKVASGRKFLLIKRTLSDVKLENYQARNCERPLVILTDSDEACEKSLWFFENGILPLVGEPNNLIVTAEAARQYGIDLVMSEQKLIKDFWLTLIKLNAAGGVGKIVLLGKNFAFKEFDFLPAGKLALVLCLPETGPFAFACPGALKQGALIFHPDNNSLLEIIDKIILTKLIFTPTPMIRYNTEIKAQIVEKECDCAAEESFILL